MEPLMPRFHMNVNVFSFRASQRRWSLPWLWYQQINNKRVKFNCNSSATFVNPSIPDNYMLANFLFSISLSLSASHLRWVQLFCTFWTDRRISRMRSQKLNQVENPSLDPVANSTDCARPPTQFFLNAKRKSKTKIMCVTLFRQDLSPCLLSLSLSF